MMDAPEIKRGQLYYIASRFEDNISGGMEAGRMALVVSSDIGNESANPYVNMVWLTTTFSSKSVNVYVKSTPKPCTVLCNKIFTIEKSRLTEYRGEISATEMEWVNRKLMLSLGLNADTSKFEETLREKEEELKSLQLENDVLKKLYEKAVQQIVELRFANDVTPAETKKPEPEPVSQPIATDDGLELVDINKCSVETLCKRLGFQRPVAQNIVAARPYRSIEDLRTVQGVTRLAYQLVETRITASPVVKKPAEPKPKVTTQGKVNVNTAHWTELHALGINDQAAKRIQAYRNKHGKFTCLEELLNVERFGKICLNKYGPMLEV